MGVFDKLVGSMRIDNDDDDFYDDDIDFEEEQTTSKGLFGRRKSEEDYYDDEPETRHGFFSSKNKVQTAPRRQMEVRMIKPTVVEDAREVVDNLLTGKAVVLNMEGLHTDAAQRIIDFVSGATYAMNGKLQKISNYIFIATPESVDLSGEFTDLLNTGSFDVSGFNLKY